LIFFAVIKKRLEDGMTEDGEINFCHDKIVSNFG